MFLHVRIFFTGKKAYQFLKEIKNKILKIIHIKLLFYFWSLKWINFKENFDNCFFSIALMMSDFVVGDDPLFWTQVSFFQKVMDVLTKESKVLEREEIIDMLTVHEDGSDIDGEMNKTDL